MDARSSLRKLLRLHGIQRWMCRGKQYRYPPGAPLLRWGFRLVPFTNAGGVIADCFQARERGLAMSIFALAPCKLSCAPRTVPEKPAGLLCSYLLVVLGQVLTHI